MNAVLEKEANDIADETETGYELPAEVATNTATENRNTLEPDAMVEVSNQSSTPPLANRIAALFGPTQVSGIQKEIIRNVNNILTCFFPYKHKYANLDFADSSSE